MAHVAAFDHSRILDGDFGLAKLGSEIEIDTHSVPGIGSLRGIADASTGDHDYVVKYGRTTGVTRGRITAFATLVENVSYPQFGESRYSFDNQLMIEPLADYEFSSEGDSGSLVITDEGLAIGILFARASCGGRYGRDVAYATPLSTIVEATRTTLLFPSA